MRSAAIGIGILCTAASAAASQRAPAVDSVAGSGRYAAVARAVSALIDHERALKGIPAVSIALVDGQRIVWSRGFGWADSAAGVRASASTVYRVGSVSKLFTDIGIMQLVERHTLDLDAPVERYLPDFHPANPFGGAITLRALTSHRAGLTREPPVGNYFDDSGPTLAATVASLNRTSLIYRPGTRTKYSNAGVAVLGYVLEHTQGQSFYPYLQHAVLDPMGLEHSAFEPTSAIEGRLAKAAMWTIDGRRFPAPTFQLGMGPCGSMYSTVLDLGRFLQILFARGVAPGGSRVLSAATLDSMWTPQFAAPGATTGYGIGFGIGRMNGRRTVGHDGAIYGFATTLLALPDDSLGVVVTATLDGVNAVTDHIARTALRLSLDARRGAPLTALDTTAALPAGRALALMGRYENSRTSLDLDEYEGRLYATPPRGGSRTELRLAVVGGAAVDTLLIADDALAFGQEIRTLRGDRIAVGRDTLRRAPTPDAGVVAMARTRPAAGKAEYTALIGEYGHDYDVLYIREKDGVLNALIEWFFEYPLERVSRNVYRFPSFGLYDGQEIVFTRGPDGRATAATVATVPFRRRALPGDDAGARAAGARCREIAIA